MGVVLPPAACTHQRRRLNYHMILFTILLLTTVVSAEYDYQHSSFQPHNSTAARTYNYNHSTYNRLDITDVILCLVLALGWTIWMLASFVRSEWHQFSDSAVVVRGNVRQVQSVPGGLPTYQAVIDYTIDCSDHKSQGMALLPSQKLGHSVQPSTTTTDRQIQIRKQFETNQILEEGFANIELLVLPEEPTTSVLKDDFDREMVSSQHDRNGCYTPLLGKRLSMGLAGFLVLMSIGGAVLVVEHMPTNDKIWGWIVLCLGVPLLLPMAILWHLAGSALHRTLQDPRRSGIVLRGAEHLLRKLECNDIMDAHACDDAPMPRRYKMRIDDPSVEATQNAGCYFIQLPKRHRSAESVVSEVSSMSSFSAKGRII